MPINSSCPNENFAALTREIRENRKYAGKTILIAWHHGMIPQLAKQLG